MLGGPAGVGSSHRRKGQKHTILFLLLFLVERNYKKLTDKLHQSGVLILCFVYFCTSYVLCCYCIIFDSGADAAGSDGGGVAAAPCRGRFLLA